jgi:hypothetical protein
MFGKAKKAEKRPAMVVFDEAIRDAIETALREHARPDLLANQLEHRVDGPRMMAATSYDPRRGF